MPRSARVFVENAAYHIIMRASQKQVVFLSEDDSACFLQLVHRYKIKYGCLIYGYCLMSNHVHFLLESPGGLKGMSRFMHGIGLAYAMLFNNKYGKTGHLWQNRYKSFLVLKDDHLINVLNYIEYNPVRAELALKPEDYRRSSYRARLLGEADIILDPLAF